MSNYNPVYFAPHIPVNTKWFGVDGVSAAVARAFYAGEVQRQYLKFTAQHAAGIIEYQRRRHVTPELIIDFNKHADAEWMDVFVTEEGVRRMSMGDMAVAIYFKESSDDVDVGLQYNGPNVTINEGNAWGAATFAWRYGEDFVGTLFCICPTYAQDRYGQQLTGFQFQLDTQRQAFPTDVLSTYNYNFVTYTYDARVEYPPYYQRYDHYPAYDRLLPGLYPPADGTYMVAGPFLDNDSEFDSALVDFFGYTPKSVWMAQATAYASQHTVTMLQDYYYFSSQLVWGTIATFDSGYYEPRYRIDTGLGNIQLSYTPRSIPMRTGVGDIDGTPVVGQVYVATQTEAGIKPARIGKAIYDAGEAARLAGKSVALQSEARLKAFRSFSWELIGEVVIPQTQSVQYTGPYYVKNPVFGYYELTNIYSSGGVAGGRVKFNLRPYGIPEFFDYMDGTQAFYEDLYG